MAMKPDERIDAAKDLLEYLKEKYPKHTLTDIAQILKIAQSAIYRKPEGEFFSEGRL